LSGQIGITPKFIELIAGSGDEMARDVFISYAQSDSETARAICDWLEVRGLSCWIAPRDLQPGTEIGQSIITAIDDSQVLALIASHQASNSLAIVREVERALNRKIPVFSILAEKTELSGQLATMIGSQSIEVSRPPSDVQLQYLADSIYQLLGRRFGTDGDLPDEKLPFWRLIAEEVGASVAIAGAVIGQVVGLVWAACRGLIDRVRSDRAVAKQIADELRVNSLEELADFRVSRSLRPVLDSLSRGLSVRLDGIAQQTKQLLQLQDSARKLEAAKVAMESVAEIQNGLHGRSGEIVKAGKEIAAVWFDLLKQASDAAQSVLDQTWELENPFIFGNPVLPQAAGLFTGRRDLVLEIERSILRAAQTPTLLLYGQRRMGKTSILNQLPALLGPSFLPVLVDCQFPATVESQSALLRYMSRCMANAFASHPGARRSGDGVSRATGLDPLAIDRLQHDPFSGFEDWLDGFQVAIGQEMNILLCLDEFERLDEIIVAGWGARFLDALRHWSQYRPRFALMFAGSHTFEQLGPVWTDRFLSARRLKVSFLHDADIRKLLTEPIPKFRLRYAQGSLDAILAATRGQPFLTQVLASELVHHLNRENRKQAEPQDIEIVIGDVLQRSAEYFADFWLSRTPEEQQVLRAVARDEPQPIVTSVTRALRDYDVLDDSGRFAVPLIMQWVQLNQLHG
jgi:hypothetical protein